MNNFTLLGDCQNLVLSLIEMCGWRRVYEEMIASYKEKYGVNHFLWEPQYNFDQIESNFETFEKDLLQGNLMKNPSEEVIESDSEEEESVLETDNQLYQILHQAGVKHIEVDDGRDLPYYGDEKKVKEATYFFINQILKGRINNTMKHDVENGEENVVLSVNHLLLTLNRANSRCFKEILKWGEMRVEKEEMI